MVKKTIKTQLQGRWIECEIEYGKLYLTNHALAAGMYLTEEILDEMISDLIQIKEELIQTREEFDKNVTKPKFKIWDCLQEGWIDNKEKLMELAKNIGMANWQDIDGIYIGANGEVALLDECGNYTFLSSKRFMPIFTE